MLMMNWKWLVLCAAAICLAGGAVHAEPAWREAYQSSPATYERPSETFIRFAAEHWHADPEKLKQDLTPQPVGGTVRYRLTLQAAGSQVRIRFSNEEGLVPLQIAGASIGLAADAFSARPGSLMRLSFGGAKGVNIPAGAPVLSDAVKLQVTPGTVLLVSIELASPMMNEGRGGAGFVAADGAQAMQDSFRTARSITGRPIVSGVSVLTNTSPQVIVALGDSITDGNRAAPTAQHGWPEVLAQRLRARDSGQRYVVVNAGISGNRLLASGWGAAALARLDRDVLRIEGISHLVVLEGVNDINFSGKSPFGNNPEITSDDLIRGYRQIIARAHARGIKVYFGTLTPNPGDSVTSTPAKVAMRDAVNLWIRTSGEPDAIIDFDAVVRDPAAPAHFKKEYDSGDHLHPSDTGYKAMGEGIDLSLFP